MKIDHIGIAVKSLVQAVTIYETTMGLKVSGYETVEDQGVKHAFVLKRNTQDLADHRHRHRIGVLIDNVEPVLALDLVEQVVTEPLNDGLHARDEAR